MTKTLLRSALLVSAVALVPAVTSGMAAVDSASYRELDQFMNVFERVRASYVDKVDDKKLLQGAIEGMLASLDPHSSYLEGQDYQNLMIQTEGNYGGLGLQVTSEDGAVKVISPTEDSPAWRAGLKSGDYITSLDGKSIIGETLDSSVEKMRGKPGTNIRLTIVRPGRDKEFDVTLTREVIDLKPVKWEVKGDVGIVNINGFSKNTGTMVRDALLGIDKSLGRRPNGYIVDLRSNPGGLLNEAVSVSDNFLERGEVVEQRGRYKADLERYFASPGDNAHGLPVIVLIDAGSASAAEIVAGALQDQHRALIMGERSFGKGSVQSIIDLDDKTALRLTTARYYTPSGRSVQEGGIEPDVPVPQLSDPDYKERKRFREVDLGKHLVNEKKVDNSLLEADTKPDPRFSMTAEQLKAKGIKDFQLYYALETLGRLSKQRTAAAAPAKTGG
jgi:carboxyl-terminal processing protease